MGQPFITDGMVEGQDQLLTGGGDEGMYRPGPGQETRGCSDQFFDLHSMLFFDQSQQPGQPVAGKHKVGFFFSSEGGKESIHALHG